MKEFTHLAEIYGFRCYFNVHTGDAKGINWLVDKIIRFCIWYDNIGMGGYYPILHDIKLIEEL